jgi:hypothetical protein
MNMRRFAHSIVLAVAGTMIAAAAWAQMPTPAAPYLNAAPPQTTRVWFYRDLDPYESLAEPYLRIDGAVIGTSVPGGAFYRDLPVGRHRVSVDSYINDKYQTIDVDAAPGRELYVKVVPNNNFVEGGGEFAGGYHRNSYVLWLYPPEVARAAIARSHVAAAAPR